MSTLRFSLHPTPLSNLLKNVLEFTAVLPRRRPGVMIHAEAYDRAGSVFAIGAAGPGAARDWAPITGAEGAEAASILVPAVAPEKTDVVDDLHKLAQAIGKTSKAKDASVFVTLEHRRRLTVEYGGQLLGELADLGYPRYDLSLYQHIDGLLELDTAELAGPTAFMTDTLKALTKVKTPTGSTVVDIARVPGHESMTVMSLGPTFQGILATVDRELYAAGGPWGDGPGTPESLVGGTHG